MTFSIVTPSFNSLEWLKLCIASVQDQSVPHEHLIQDPGSSDGTIQWLQKIPDAGLSVEADSGMYDAINKGLARATGQLLAYLNCDEQYLPGTLARVAQFFREHPSVEVLFADAVIVNAEGKFMAYRKAILPLQAHTWLGSSLSILTCATFFRRSIVEKGLLFDPTFRSVGDAEWVLRLLKANVRMALFREYTSVFTETGTNLSLNPKAAAELAAFRDRAPIWMRAIRPVIEAHHRFRRFFHGAYRQGPFNYSIFTRESPTVRTTFAVQEPTFRWRR